MFITKAELKRELVRHYGSEKSGAFRFAKAIGVPYNSLKRYLNDKEAGLNQKTHQKVAAGLYGLDHK